MGRTEAPVRLLESMFTHVPSIILNAFDKKTNCVWSTSPCYESVKPFETGHSLKHYKSGIFLIPSIMSTISGHVLFYYRQFHETFIKSKCIIAKFSEKTTTI